MDPGVKRLAAVELFAEGAKNLEFDPVLRTAGSTLHRHEVVKTRHVDGLPEYLDSDRT